MNFEYFIARRVAFTKGRSFARLIIRIAIVAIALSMTVMISATALIRGFKNQISTKIFGFWGDIHITDANVTRTFEAIPVDMNQPFYPSLDTLGPIQYTEAMTFLGWEIPGYQVKKMTRGGIRHIQVYANLAGIIKTKDQIEGVILKGIGKDFDWQFLNRYLLEGRKINLPDTVPSNEVIISRQTADRMRLKLGSKFIIHFVRNNEQMKRVFEVCGIYKTGLEEYDRKFALVDIRQIQQLLGWTEQQVNGFEVFVDDIHDLDNFSDYIYSDVLPNNLFAETIKQKFPSIFEWLGLQDINEVVILALMIVVSIINMVTALLILILERTNMIGILKALGASNWTIQKTFLYHAAFIVGTGLFWGNVIGLTLCWLQEHFQFIRLSEADYYLSYAPIELNLWSILFLNAGTLMVTLVFLILPSFMVALLSPVKAIRFK